MTDWINSPDSCVGMAVIPDDKLQRKCLFRKQLNNAYRSLRESNDPSYKSFIKNFVLPKCWENYSNA